MRASSVDQVILETLSRQQAHMTSLQMYEQIKGRLPAVNQSTVYRALERLARDGKVSVSDMGTGAAVYELLVENQHHHLVCQSCGRVEALDPAEVATFFDQAARYSGYRITTNHLILFGVCPGCQKITG